jgi:ParB-like chromosome segregation protein Spo0J
MIKWKRETRNISELKQYEANPRKITEKGLKDLKASIKKFGVDSQPIIINTDNVIVGGHARLLACESLGLDTVAVSVPTKKLTDKQFQELNIRLNKNVAGEFDFELLENFFEESDLIDWGFDEVSYEPIDTAEDWAGLDEEFEGKSKEYKVTCFFTNEKLRAEYIEKHKIRITKNIGGQLVSRL